MFTAAASARNAMYRLGMLYAHRIATPVISVGNLRVGGSGKTPLVIWLAERLQQEGMRVVVVSRGYGRRTNEPTVVTAEGGPADASLAVSPCGNGFEHVHVRADGTLECRTPHAEPADEAVLIAMRTGAPVLVAPDRVLACRSAERLFAPDVILLDDGFQHLRLARDLDVVLVSGEDLAARALPAGPLRECASALERADFVVRTDGEGEGPLLSRRPGDVVTADGGRLARASILARKHVVAVAGVAAPEGFEAMLDELGARRVASLRYEDHHRYDGADRRTIEAAAADADLIVTTEKDLVKLRTLFGSDPRLVALRLDAELSGAGPLLERISRLDAKDSGLHHRPLDRTPHGPAATAGPPAGTGARGVSG
jgi:tetraacyldisaccharide 4'-kinase